MRPPRITRLFKSLFITAAVVTAGFTTAFADASATEPIKNGSRLPLWEGRAPGAVADTDKDKPIVEVYLPETGKANGAAIVILPGGGYGGLAFDHEGRQIAKWLNGYGIAGFVVKYRTRGDGYGHPAPLLDAQRALRFVRTRATEFGIDAKRVGIMGFSAGGHLASTTATHFDAGSANATDVIDRASSRPDFAVLCYPVITLGEPSTHRGSQKNLLGADADPKLIESLSNEKQVTKETPPTFLFHTDADKGVVPENSVLFYLALRKAGVPAELHIYQKGSHGLGLAKAIPGTNEWPNACINWLKGLGVIPAAQENLAVVPPTPAK